uniref:Protein kinase domain-containing protein n=1 Tax=Macrostomum lignano TaxID=282301 RepID=A0A1I8F9Q0_9PLAT
MCGVDQLAWAASGPEEAGCADGARKWGKREGKRNQSPIKAAGPTIANSNLSRNAVVTQAFALTVPANAIGPKARTRRCFLAALSPMPGFGPVLWVRCCADKQDAAQPVVACGPVEFWPRLSRQHGFWSVSVTVHCRRFFFGSIGGKLRATAARRRRLSAADTADRRIRRRRERRGRVGCTATTGMRPESAALRRAVPSPYEGSYLRAPAIAAVTPASAAVAELDATTATAPPGPLASATSWHRGLGRYCLIGQSQEGGNAVQAASGWAAFAASPMQSSAEFCLRLARTAGHARTRWSWGAADRGAGRPAPGWWTRRGSWLFATEASSCASALRSCRWAWRSKSQISGDTVRSRVEAAVKPVCTAPSAWSTWTRLDRVCPAKIVVYQNHYYNSRASGAHCQQQERSARFESAVPGRLPCWPQVELEFTPIRRKTVFRLPPRLRVAPSVDYSTRPVAAAATGGCLVACLAWSGWLGQLAGRPSPTDCLLDLWEARCRGEEALIELADSLKADGQAGCSNCISIAALSWPVRVPSSKLLPNFHSSSPAAVVSALAAYQRVAHADTGRNRRQALSMAP